MSAARPMSRAVSPAVGSIRRSVSVRAELGTARVASWLLTASGTLQTLHYIKLASNNGCYNCNKGVLTLHQHVVDVAQIGC